MNNDTPSPKEITDLLTLSLSFKDDPLGWVMAMFPWGEPNTPLHNHKSPRTWQADTLDRIRLHRERNRDTPQVQRIARSSGRAIGKSASMGLISLFNMCTALGSTTQITANTDTQLRTITFPEVKKWLTLCRMGSFFETTATSIKPKKWFATLLQEQMKIDTSYYYVTGKAWSEENPDAFAGLHSHLGVTILFDEASGIPKSIFDVTLGFFTEPIPNRLWVCFSNPRRASGTFHEIMTKKQHIWDTASIDSRTVEGVDHTYFDQIVEEHGESSDVVRVEVKGEFPVTGYDQFISSQEVNDAFDRQANPEPAHTPLVFGVDVARKGDNKSVIAAIRGRDGSSIPPVVVQGYDTNQLADLVMGMINKYKPDAVFIDGAGVGGGVVDTLKRYGANPIEVNGGNKASQPTRYLNKRCECYDRLREWIKTGSLKYDAQLFNELTAMEYSYNEKTRQLVLETKADMRSRGIPSPDISDAYSMCFAQVVGYSARGTNNRQKSVVSSVGY